MWIKRKKRERERRSDSHFSFYFLFFVRYSKGTNVSDATKFDFGCSSLRRVSRNYFIRGHNPGRSWTCVLKSPLPTMGQVVLKMSFRGLQVGRVGYMRAAQSTLTVILGSVCSYFLEGSSQNCVRWSCLCHDCSLIIMQLTSSNCQGFL